MKQAYQTYMDSVEVSPALHQKLLGLSAPRREIRYHQRRVTKSRAVPTPILLWMTSQFSELWPCITDQVSVGKFHGHSGKPTRKRPDQPGPIRRFTTTGMVR